MIELLEEDYKILSIHFTNLCHNNLKYYDENCIFKNDVYDCCNDDICDECNDSDDSDLEDLDLNE